MKKVRNYIILVVLLLIVLGYYFGITPLMKFNEYEKKMIEAARNYYNYYSNELPTGERIKTLSLKRLYSTSYLKDDIYVPNSKKYCSLDNSWVKVKRENGDYKYFVYLDCGIYKSSIDHTGPVITLNDGDKINVVLGEEYKDSGVKSVIDNKDGKLDISNVTVNGSVDSNKVGEYEVIYTAYDSLGNKTEKIRTVNVIQELYYTMKGKLKESSNFVGLPNDNYVMFSNILFQVFGVDDNKNVILVSSNDVGNANYSKLDEWLDYFYGLLNDKSKELIVPSKFCNMDVSEDNFGVSECTSYTKERNVYIPSIIDVLKAEQDGSNFMKAGTMSWVSNKKNDKEAYLTRFVFFDEEYGKDFLAYPVDDVYGIRPMIVVKGDSILSKGDGSINNPYRLGDTTKGKAGSSLNERNIGEYITYSNLNWRIVDTLSDGTTKVILSSSIGNLRDNVNISYTTKDKVKIYNPKNKYNVAYKINNSVSSYFDTDLFVKHEITVPIYKDKFIYNSEVDTKKYSVLLSAPNMFEIFSSVDNSGSLSYWCLNSSKKVGRLAAISDIGVPVNDLVSPEIKFGSRVVAYVKKDVVIVSGDGTHVKPYVIK